MDLTEQSFLKDVAQHQMKVLLDNGLYRHIQFRKPGTGIMAFNLVTWPGYLAYSGDMGDYMFTRLPDMFEFFRNPSADSPLRVNLGYWSEKIVAADRDGVTTYSAKRFRECIREWVDEAGVSSEVRRAVEREILPFADEGEHEARRAVEEFEHDGFQFSDFWEADLHKYTYRFVWCCYAIAWGIRQYDQRGNQ